MKSVCLHIGEKIRWYRKARKMTLEEVAQKLGKSKATISKYEKAEIAMDIEILCEIALILEVTLGQLTEGVEEMILQKMEPHTLEEHVDVEYFLYFYDGRRKRIVESRIAVEQMDASGVSKATLFSDIGQYPTPNKRQSVYVGTMQKFDAFLNFQFANQNNRVEQIFLYGINSFRGDGKMVGLLTGLSTYPMTPVSFKFLLSPERLECGEELQRDLLLSHNEKLGVKKFNMCIVEPML